MSLRKHALQILSLYVLALLGGLFILRNLASPLALWLDTAFLLIVAGAAWYYNSKLKIPNTVEESGALPNGTVTLYGVIGIVLVLVAQLAGGLLESVLFHTVQTSAATNQQVQMILSAPGYFLAAAVALPILEELAFRKVLFGDLAAFTGTFGAALISSLLYAFATDWTHWLTYTLVGFVYAYIYKRTSSLTAPLLAHIGVVILVLVFSWARLR